MYQENKLDIPESFKKERIESLENETIPFNNEILKKLGKPPITLEEIKKKSEQIYRTE